MSVGLSLQLPERGAAYSYTALSLKNSMEYLWIILLLPAFFARSHGSCGAPPRLDYGQLDTEFVDTESFPVDTKVTYSCRPGFIRVPGTQNSITCLSDSTWSTPSVFCTRRSCGHPGDAINGKSEITDTLFGSRVYYTCDPGYHMISRRNFRECQADGTWSNEVPVCEVQKCPPPNAIADGSFSPSKEEYDYQDAVRYECRDKALTLVGESTLSCTANGNWSADAPQCKVIECKDPNVENSEKLSGFVGPYTLNSAVRFQCLKGHTMDGEPFVTCNAKGQWEPPLPTCRSIVPTTTTTTTTTTTKKTETGGIVTQSPTTKKTETGGSSATQKPSPAKEKDEDNGAGNNIGAIVGGIIAGIVGILFAAITYVWCKKSRGGGYVAGKKHESGTPSGHQTTVEQCGMQQIEAQETQ
ncbi:membrane cofactor protein-like isoform X4 [Dendropsophus ebraccatus]|uniref:membrane cofactor protein-like isoform X4 n=1 Tax=Dendropsophus ebraccatus TaxID=150705 RepID=UPI00383192EB